MTQQHTEGRLHLQSAESKILRTETGLAIAEVSDTWRIPSSEIIANAERLAACWNAFKGVDGDPETLLANLLEAARKSIEDLETWHDEAFTRQDRQGTWVSYPCDGCETCSTTLPKLRAALSPFVGKKSKASVNDFLPSIEDDEESTYGDDGELKSEDEDDD